MQWNWKSWRLVFLVPPVGFFIDAGQQWMAHRAVVDRIEHGGRPTTAVAPTVYGEHSGLAVTLGCVGLIFVVLSFRARSAPPA
ncbi:MAG: hypothetical protein WD768_01335 [Phycisphaeraceae bacterium]